MNHNPNAVHPKSLEYDVIRGDYVITHNRMVHNHDDTLVLHFPVEMECMKP